MERAPNLNVLVSTDAIRDCVRQLEDAGYRVETFHTIAAASVEVERGATGVWVAAFDEVGEEFVRWANRHAPALRTVLVALEGNGVDVHRGYELGAAFCLALREGRVVEAVDFLVNGLQVPPPTPTVSGVSGCQRSESEKVFTLSLPLAGL